jgi:hypothetical protein
MTIKTDELEQVTPHPDAQLIHVNNVTEIEKLIDLLEGFINYYESRIDELKEALQELKQLKVG